MINDQRKGIPISTCFNLAAAMPIDPRIIVQNRNDLLALTEVDKYPGMHVYLMEENVQFRLTENGQWQVHDSGFCSGDDAPTSDDGKIGDMYIRSNGDVYFKVITDYTTLTVEWSYVLSIKGVKGDQGIQGNTGTRGSLWFIGTAITGTDTTDTIFPLSGLSNVLINDQYFNSLTGNVYICNVAGIPTVAKWSYRGTIMGQQGPTGERGETGSIGETGATGLRGETGIDGTYIITGNAISGDTDIDGSVFPDAHDNGKIFRTSDIYLNTTTGELYMCLSGGKINEILWIKKSTLMGNKTYVGTVLSGQSSSISGQGIVFFANVDDYYLNSNTGEYYICINAGMSGSVWKYITSLKGPKGDRGTPGTEVFYRDITIAETDWYSISGGTLFEYSCLIMDVLSQVEGSEEIFNIDFYVSIDDNSIDNVLDHSILIADYGTSAEAGNGSFPYLIFRAKTKPTTDTLYHLVLQRVLIK